MFSQYPETRKNSSPNHTKISLSSSSPEDFLEFKVAFFEQKNQDFCAKNFKYIRVQGILDNFRKNYVGYIGCIHH